MRDKSNPVRSAFSTKDHVRIGISQDVFENVTHFYRMIPRSRGIGAAPEVHLRVPSGNLQDTRNDFGGRGVAYTVLATPRFFCFLRKDRRGPRHLAPGGSVNHASHPLRILFLWREGGNLSDRLR